MAIAKNYENVIIEDARLGFLNFSGRETKFNREGNRNFVIFVNKETADELSDKGWSIKVRPPREEGDEESYYLPVSINFNFHQPPKVKMIQGKRGVLLSEETVGELDFAHILKADVVVRPRYWVDDRTGEDRIKAYLHTLRVEVEPDYFADEDEDIIY